MNYLQNQMLISLFALFSIIYEEMAFKLLKIASTWLPGDDFKSTVFHFFQPSFLSSFSVPGLVATHRIVPETYSKRKNSPQNDYLWQTRHLLIMSLTMPAPTPRPLNLAEVTRISRRVKCSAPSARLSRARAESAITGPSSGYPAQNARA